MHETEAAVGQLNDFEKPPLLASVSPRQEEVSLLDLLIVILRDLRFIVGTSFGLAILGLIAALLLPNRYKAITTILPPAQNSSIGAALASQISGIASLAGGGSLGLKNPADLQVALLKSRTVEDAIVDRYHLMDRFNIKFKSAARKKLENIADIEASTKDGLINITITDHDPKFAADMANGYVEEFKKYTAGLAVTEAGQRRIFFEQQLLDAKNNLASAEEELKKTELKTGVIQLDSQARAAISLVADLRAQIAAKQAEISAMRTFATDENPALQLAQQQLAGLQAQAAKMGATSENATNALIPKGSMQESGLEYVRKYRDVKYYETIFELIARQYEIAKVDEAKQGSIIQVVDRAVVPDHKSFPSKTIFILAGGFLGLFFGILWVFIREGIHRIATNPNERERVETLKSLLPQKRTTQAISR